MIEKKCNYEEGRRRLDNYIRETEGTFPNKDTIYEYYVDPKTKTWGLLLNYLLNNFVTT
jgi:hypothetical protein